MTNARRASAGISRPPSRRVKKESSRLYYGGRALIVARRSSSPAVPPRPRFLPALSLTNQPPSPATRALLVVRHATVNTKVQAEAVLMVAKATELFLEKFARDSHKCAVR